MTNAFNLSQLANNVNTSGQLNAAAGLYNAVPVANGGTNATSLTGNGALIMNSAGTTVTSVAAGAVGNVLTSDGTTWVSGTSGGAVPILNVYTTPGTWSKPATLKGIKVTVVGGGANGTNATSPAASPGGGAGGNSIQVYPAPSIPGPQPYTVGAVASTSSFGVTSVPAPFTVITSTGASGQAGGTGSGGQININGQRGNAGLTNGINPQFGVSGSGGNSLLGFGGGSVAVSAGGASNGLAATGYGSGGGGAIRLAPNTPGPNTGGAGTAGVIIVEEFY